MAELQIVLPGAPKPSGLYRPILVAGEMVHVSGHAPIRADGSRIVGRLGADLDVDTGRAAARQAGVAILATLKAELGSLERIKRVVKVVGFVNATPEFEAHPAVINGCSELFRDLFGDNGIGTRSAVGVSSLPGGIAVEIEAVFQLHESR